ncbi:MAG: hypothetical protein E5W20_02845, partial [Mesorhizobium sp.]
MFDLPCKGRKDASSDPDVGRCPARPSQRKCLMTLHDVALDDKFDLGKERIFLSGAQAVIRM